MSVHLTTVGVHNLLESPAWSTQRNATSLSKLSPTFRSWPSASARVRQGVSSQTPRPVRINKTPKR
eukprot:1389660-Amphidinium_carterae.1